MAIKLSTAARDALATALNTEIGASAVIRIYSGSRPADPSVAIGAQVLLAQLTGNAAGFGSVSGGVLTAAAITEDSSADTNGTASFFRVFKSNGTTAVADGDVGTSGADLNLNTTTLVAGGPVRISSLTFTMGGA